MASRPCKDWRKKWFGEDAVPEEGEVGPIIPNNLPGKVPWPGITLQQRKAQLALNAAQNGS